MRGMESKFDEEKRVKWSSLIVRLWINNRDEETAEFLSIKIIKPTFGCCHHEAQNETDSINDNVWMLKALSDASWWSSRAQKDLMN